MQWIERRTYFCGLELNNFTCKFIQIMEKENGGVILRNPTPL
jgi:hypothetical protein